MRKARRSPSSEPPSRRLTALLAARIAGAGAAGEAARAEVDALLAEVALDIARERGLDQSAALEPLRALAERSRGATIEVRGLVGELVALARTEGADTALGSVHEAGLDAVDLASGRAGLTRRSAGAHFTPRSLTSTVVARALDALGPSRIARATVCDPALGGGAFLCETLRQIGGQTATPSVRRRIAARLVGIDRDPRAVEVARLALWLEVGDPSMPLHEAGELHVGDALLGEHALVAEPSALESTPLTPQGLLHGAAHRAGGFDLVLGNPPFLGGKRLRTVHGDAYTEALVRLHPGTSKNVDLAAHFLSRAYENLAEGGVVGFVVTNTIAQGATRRGGLALLLERGASIVAAERRVPWPGVAGVVVSTVHLQRGAARASPVLDGVAVASIDSFLSAARREAPPRIEAQRRRAFIGCFLRGAGFVIDDADPRATPSAELDEALRADPATAAVVRPFLGGEEVVTDPRHQPHRRVIHFGAMSEAEARGFPGAFGILERRVRPVREALGGSPADRQHKAAWWRFANPRPELGRAIAELARVIVVPRLSAHLVAVRVPNLAVYSDQLVVFASDSPAVLAVLSSRIHELWARAMCSTLGDGLRYVPTDAFETFPFPAGGFEASAADARLASAGESFERARRAALEHHELGLTKLMRRVHDPRDVDGCIQALRVAWAELEREVAHAYGWDPELVVPRFTEDERGRVRLGFDAGLRAELLGRLDALAQRGSGAAVTLHR
jgi:hypothetical protein